MRTRPSYSAPAHGPGWPRRSARGREGRSSPRHAWRASHGDVDGPGRAHCVSRSFQSKASFSQQEHHVQLTSASVDWGGCELVVAVRAGWPGSGEQPRRLGPRGRGRVGAGPLQRVVQLAGPVRAGPSGFGELSYPIRRSGPRSAAGDLDKLVARPDDIAISCQLATRVLQGAGRRPDVDIKLHGARRTGTSRRVSPLLPAARRLHRRPRPGSATRASPERSPCPPRRRR